MRVGAGGGLLLLGAGGHGRVVADIAEERGWMRIEFLDDRWPDLRSNLSWPVSGRIEDLPLENAGAATVLVTIGDNKGRLRLFDRTRKFGFGSTVLQHSAAIVSRHAAIAEGTVLMPGAIVNAGASVGRAAIVNTGATIDHDCYVGDGAHISPGAHLGGGVRIGAQSWIGIGASVREGITIGARCIVGAGAVVVADILDDSIALGVPARARARNEPASA